MRGRHLIDSELDTLDSQTPPNMRAAAVLRNAAKSASSAAAAGKPAPMSADQSLYHLEPVVSPSLLRGLPSRCAASQ